VGVGPALPFGETGVGGGGTSVLKAIQALEAPPGPLFAVTCHRYWPW
jgi:hypothetical protein